MSSKVTFVDPHAASEYDCGICLSKLVKPVYIGCGSHIFCYQCIIDLISHTHGNKFPCPSCRKLCHSKHINRMEWIDRRMDQLQVRCPNFEISNKKAQLLRNHHMHHKITIKKEKDTHHHNSHTHNRHRSLTRNHNRSRSNSPSPLSRSRSRDRRRSDSQVTQMKREEDNITDSIELCEWIGDWCNLKKHKQECPYHVIKCVYCHKLVIRKDILDHNNVCMQYPVRCNQCGKEGISRNKISHHLTKECELGHISCHKCKQIIIRKNSELHKKQCPEIKIYCDYYNIGCKVQIKRKDYEMHNRDFMTLHLGLMNKQNKDLRVNMDGLQHKNYDLERKNMNLEKKLNDMKNEYDERISNMEHRINLLSGNGNGNHNNGYVLNMVSDSDNESQQSGSEVESSEEESDGGNSSVSTSNDGESDESNDDDDSVISSGPPTPQPTHFNGTHNSFDHHEFDGGNNERNNEENQSHSNSEGYW